MKRSCLLPTVLFLSAISAFAQERPNYLDTFDTQTGVTFYRPASLEADPEDKGTASGSTPGAAVKHYLPSPQSGAKPANPALVRKTVHVTMTVNDGYAQPESPQSAETARLIMATGLHMKGYTTGDALVDAFIVDSSRRYRIEPLLIYAQMGQESSFKLKALSNKGASGLMQLMPATARRLGVTNIYDPKQNIEGGVKYMRMLLDMFGQDVNLALAGYNAGEGAVMKYGYQIPPYNETRDYVRRISARHKAISTPTMARYTVQASPVGPKK